MTALVCGVVVTYNPSPGNFEEYRYPGAPVPTFLVWTTPPTAARKTSSTSLSVKADAPSSAIALLLFGQDRMLKIKYMLRGLWDGIFEQLGRRGIIPGAS
ncbi:MAG: hypothetical protein V4587_00930 [Acidobacteriota bacterium]